ncbi:hypothetical protein CL629_02090 [bacterium]|nr:hypothetical protein [bacterium]|tara:strand:- start:5074 stop:5475 length:402 start_codon:yes stop_codon:yes gene_type:complete
MKKDLIKALAEALRKNLTGGAGSAILDQLARTLGEEDMIIVSVYKKSDSLEDSLVPFLDPLHEFRFKPHECELAFETMRSYDIDDFSVSISYGGISNVAMDSIRIAPYFEFLSSQSPVGTVLSGNKAEYVGEA